MNVISAQVSVYPLRQPHLGPTISRVLDALRGRGLDVRPGTMSTVVIGETDALFAGLKESFHAAAAIGDVVMAVSISNCCPLPGARDHSDPV
jgi:uncharacterized protein YqgV (UPF0045/DUF77 family)